jgi:hypothetical protein
MSRSHAPTIRRTLCTATGTVQYVDSGWTPSEWALIARAVEKMDASDKPRGEHDPRPLALRGGKTRHPSKLRSDLERELSEALDRALGHDDSVMT